MAQSWGCHQHLGRVGPGDWASSSRLRQQLLDLGVCGRRWRRRCGAAVGVPGLAPGAPALALECVCAVVQRGTCNLGPLVQCRQMQTARALVPPCACCCLTRQAPSCPLQSQRPSERLSAHCLRWMRIGEPASQVSCCCSERAQPCSSGSRGGRWWQAVGGRLVIHGLQRAPWISGQAAAELLVWWGMDCVIMGPAFNAGEAPRVAPSACPPPPAR